MNSALSHIDNAMQYGEDEEPKMPDDMDEGMPHYIFIVASPVIYSISFPSGDVAGVDD